ncbi:MAG TPA: ferritin-like domain-containing protein [Candidatus Ratteibacteria bacterium]|jgi:bacterioferritin|uniref:Bacterioferritin n=1 Tax=candidate division TA06 bacterium ADurb.Bin131 TaxID=1852827 RepID=A0A1V6CAJ9_UNCT6|nr:MAG: bacterioferritin [candidate division TA06 bacterium ADurb.Bin131]HON05385.1 ferritin-like domain-containing protein [bacterium]HRS06205.1 ferritin-like domain-containing protein [Candidatus Ratteibacteria bacterium]HPC29040.1 ferritin-like domain-containing protein [bacterium]HQL64713.1 ferritin-like domain-containing protein [bacterium]
MKRKGLEIINADVNQIIDQLNKALSDEWLAYYQYWLGEKLVKGKFREEVAAELGQHAGDELKHAGMIADRIIQLGGTPVLKPEDWYKLTNCGYEAPEDPSVIPVLKQNIKGEQCAIGVYQKLAETLKDKDPITYYMVLSILKDEVEHEDDLINILEDIQ